MRRQSCRSLFLHSGGGRHDRTMQSASLAVEVTSEGPIQNAEAMTASAATMIRERHFLKVEYATICANRLNHGPRPLPASIDRGAQHFFGWFAVAGRTRAERHGAFVPGLQSPFRAPPRRSDVHFAPASALPPLREDFQLPWLVIGRSPRERTG